jgi:hypothetical protein
MRSPSRRSDEMVGPPPSVAGSGCHKWRGEKSKKTSEIVPGEWVLQSAAGAILRLEALWDT